ncbi:MAG TPA: bifunctional 2',3'-cyclic-nucleotide 2'-phosphodiesterase/3'-nucleotidase, partial [Alphaproteobacteria bacterium]|nr:bifunctional 2',3'-cyclic-nucleotide 2'-phosphodiesterase/3'-nucleotidase [Alphaproteobacteria bacterium]
EAPDENRTALIEYIQQKKEVNPSADNNWSLTAGGKPVTVVFDSSPAAEKYLASNAKLSKIGAGENGFTKYGLKVE